MAAFLRPLHRWCMGLVLGATALLAWAQSPLEVPALSARVMDQTSTLTEAQRLALDNKLAAFETAAGSQLVVLIVPTTAPEDIASYANRIGNAWKIGRKDVGDGLLLVVAKNDRKLRIEVAKALEGAVPDVAAKHVIDEVITPRFKQGDFAGGIDAGIERLMQLVRKEGLPTPETTPEPPEPAWSDGVWGLGIFFGLMTTLMVMVAGPAGLLLGVLVTTFAVPPAALAWFLTHSTPVMVIFAIFGAMGAFKWMSTWKTTTGTSAVAGASKPPPPKTDSSTDSSWWSSSSSSSSSSDSGSWFSSGGGGDFGGGGASGSW